MTKKLASSIRLIAVAALAACALSATAGYADTPTPAPAAATNLALNKKFVSSSPNKYGWNGLTDGSWVGQSPDCYATDEDDAFPKTVTIDLEKTASIGSVVIGIPVFGATKTVEVSLSTDNKTFTAVGSNQFDQKKEVKYTYKFAPTDARYVRLTYKDHWDDGNGYSNTYVFTEEAEVYAPTK